jgi:glutaredoxin
MQTQVLGLSVDSVPCLKAWADSLGGITYPLLSDFFPHGHTALSYGVLRAEGYTERAIFIVDKQGVVRYVDVHDISKQPDNDELFRALAAIEPGLAVPPAVKEAPAVPAMPAGPKAEVVMYCTSWCPDCRRARAYFKDHNVTVTEIDIGRDRDSAAKVRGWAKGAETTPTFDIRNTIIVGFDLPKIEAALAAKG